MIIRMFGFRPVAACCAATARASAGDVVIGGRASGASAYLQSYKAFPPRQRPASFSIDQVIDKLETTTKGK